MNVGWRVETDPRMPVLMVVAVDDQGYERLRVCEAAKTFRERRREFQGFEPRLRVGIIVTLTG